MSSRTLCRPSCPKFLKESNEESLKLREPNPYVVGPSVWAQPIVLWALKLQP